MIMAVLVCFGASAQTFNTKSIPTNAATPTASYGHQAFNYLTGTICTIVTGTVTPMPSTRAADTLKSPATGITGYATDSGYVQFPFNSRYGRLFRLDVTKISGTLAGSAFLQGSWDNANWFNITGRTTYCTSCVGDSATITNTSGTKQYQWDVPDDAPAYPYYQIFPNLSGTCTATFTGKAGYSN